jgi:uracil-DNA glycosylase
MPTQTLLGSRNIHPSWRPLLESALLCVNSEYLKTLQQNPNWLPGVNKLFNAFSIPLAETRYILFGESPYPRAASANGYAFWDAAVHSLWSEKGLSLTVNRATSLRNFIKMLLVAAGDLNPNNTSQAAIAALDKHAYINTLDELFTQLLKHGFLLLNATLSLTENGVQKDAKAWQPFIAALLNALAKKTMQPELILWGNIAKQIDKLEAAQHFQRGYAEHPYNLSFITNTSVLDFFRPFALLKK